MLPLQILCVGIAAIALSIGESEAGTHHYTIPASKMAGGGNEHVHKYTIPGETHTYRYKLPGKTNVHSYKYKTPGQTNKHTFRYKEPGKVNTHHYRIPGDKGDGTNPQDVSGGANPQDVTGVYSVINTIYNYFAVGGHLTGVPPLDILLLKFYVAQGPKTFCPNGGK